MQWSKPPCGTLLDRSAALANGLVCFFPLNEGNGINATDVCNGIQLLTYQSSGYPGWSNGPSPYYGCGLNLTGAFAHAGSTGTLPAAVQVGPVATLVTAFTVGSGGIGGSTELFGIYYDNSSSVHNALVLHTNSSGGVFVSTNNGGSSAAFTASANTTYIIVCVVTKTTWTFYVYPFGGTPATYSGTWSNSTAPTYASTAGLGFGPVFGNATNPNCTFYFGAIYNRALSATEAAAWGQNPWQLMQALWPAGKRSRKPAVFTIPRQTVRPPKLTQTQSPAGNPTVRPKHPTVSLTRPPARTVRAILQRINYAPPVVGFPPRYFPVPFRPRPRGGQPFWLRQSIPGIAPTVPPIAFNLDAWAAQLLSVDSDPLAVHPDGAVAVSSDSDPLAVDPDSAIQVN